MRSLDFTLGRGYRSAVWVVGRTTKRSVHPIDQVVGHRVFQTLGFIVNVVLIVVQLFDQIRLDDSVTPQHAQGLLLAVCRQPNAAISRMLQQPDFG